MIVAWSGTDDRGALTYHRLVGGVVLIAKDGRIVDLRGTAHADREARSLYTDVKWWPGALTKSWDNHLMLA